MRWFIIGIALSFNLFTLPLSPLSELAGVFHYAKLPVYRLLYQFGWQTSIWYGVNGILLLSFALTMIKGLLMGLQVRANKRIPNIHHIHQLQAMQWQDFESLMQQLFEKQGFSVERIGGNGADGGIDLILRHPFPKCLLQRPIMVQCKRYHSNHKVGISKIREYAYIRQEHKFSSCIIVTTSEFTRQAKEQAKKENGKMVLMDGLDILYQIKRLA